MTTPAGARPQGAVTVVVITHNRRPRLLASLEHLVALPERPPVMVVDNASTDGTADAVRVRFPDVDLVPLTANLGAAGRNVGVARATTPYVAFSDDDSWWEPGALATAVRLLDDHSGVGLLATRVLVGEERRPDPTCALMAESPLPRPVGAAGPSVLGFLACGAVVRRQAYLSVGGFASDLGVGGEEELLALDLTSAGWLLVYAEEVVAHHHPPPGRDPAARRRIQTRNRLRVAWTRLPVGLAARETAQVVPEMIGSPAVRRGVLDAARGASLIVRRRSAVPPSVAAGRRALRTQGSTPREPAG